MNCSTLEQQRRLEQTLARAWTGSQHVAVYGGGLKIDTLRPLIIPYTYADSQGYYASVATLVAALSDGHYEIKIEDKRL